MTSQGDHAVKLFAPLYRVAVLTLSSGVLFGYSTASIAGWLGSIAKEFDLNTSAQEYFTFSLVISCFVGAVAAGFLARRLGRRGTLLIAFLLALLGYAGTLMHPNLFWLVGMRILIGLSVGLSSMVAPMYAGETVLARYRGGVISLFQLAVTIGILVAYTIPLWLTAPENWPLAIGGGGVIALIGLAALASVPESPVWLRSAHREEEAIAATHALGLPPHEPSAGHTGGDQPVETKMSLSAFRKQLILGTTPAILVLCCGMFILQNLSGIDGILYYAPTIFTELGFEPGVAALTATFGLGLINVVATIIAIATIDKIGRRPLAIVGGCAMVVGLAGVVAAQMMAMPTLGLVGLCIYIAAFAISLGPLPYILMAELVPSSMREMGVASASATSWLFNALVALFFLSGVSYFGLDGVFIFFGCICFIMLVITVIWLPETKGTSLDEIEANVLAGVPLRHVGDASKAK